jgi:serine/threonine protein kinase
MNVREIFIAARNRPSPTERSAYLDEVCGTQTAVRAEVEELLREHEQLGSFLESPAAMPAVTVEEPFDDRPGTTLGNYKLLEQIGEGGFGLVFAAEQQEPVRRTVALKLIKPGMDTRQVIARFEAERQALAIMDHPNIARVFDAGASKTGRPYFVMELVRGIPITDYCDRHRLTPHERLDLFVTVCQAVQHAHQKGIIHRDIKPSNVLVTEHDSRAVVKVIDFGIAKAVNQQLTDRSIYTHVAQMIGTPVYMSPEQADMSGLDIDTRTDIYSLGVLLYELLTGNTPLDKKRVGEAAYDEIRRVIREEEPEKPSSRLSHSADSLPSVAAQRKMEPAKLSKLVRGDLDWITMKALEKDRARRYETATGLADDIRRYLADEPVQARPPSTAYRLRKFASKHRRFLAVAAACALLLVAASAVSIFLAVWALRAEKTANEERNSARKRLDQVESGIHVLSSVFANLDPRAEEKDGRPLRAILADRLDQAAASLEGDAIGDPLMVAGLQDRLGLSLCRLGWADQAVSLLTKARDTRAKILGPDHPDTLDSMNNLASAYGEAGKPNQALELRQETVRIWKARKGENDPNTLRSMHNLASAYQAVGKHNLALELLEEVVRRKKETMNGDELGLFSSMNNLAGAYLEAARTDEAIALHIETLRLRTARFGRDHSDTLNSLSNLAFAYKTAGQLERALPLLEEVFQLQKAKLGPDHPDTLASMTNLASAYRADNQIDKAIPLLEEAFQLWKARRGPDHPETLHSMNSLAVGYFSADRLDKALPLYEETLRLRKAKLGADHPSTLTSMNNLAAGYQAAGQIDRAIPLFEEALRLRQTTDGAHHPNTLGAMANLGSAYRAQNKLDQALPLFKQAAVGMEMHRFRHAHAARIVGNLTGCIEQMQQFPEAEMWRRKWLAALKETGPQEAAYATELAALGANLLQQKKWPEAETCAREAHGILAKKTPDGWALFHSDSVWGGALLGQSKYAEAEPYLLRGYEGLKARETKIPKDEKSRLSQALERLVNLYDAWGKQDEANRWRLGLNRKKES